MGYLNSYPTRVPTLGRFSCPVTWKFSPVLIPTCNNGPPMQAAWFQTPGSFPIPGKAKWEDWKSFYDLKRVEIRIFWLQIFLAEAILANVLSPQSGLVTKTPKKRKVGWFWKIFASSLGYNAHHFIVKNKPLSLHFETQQPSRDSTLASLRTLCLYHWEKVNFDFVLKSAVLAGRLDEKRIAKENRLIQLEGERVL